jgi:hypothetical protein
MNHDHSAPNPATGCGVPARAVRCALVAIGNHGAATLAWVALPASQLGAFVTENGPVESATAVLYGFAMVAVLFAARSGTDWKTPAAILIGMAGLVARELDLHRTAANDSVLRVSFHYGHAPLQTRLFALAIIGLVLLAVGYLAVRHTAPMLRALRQARPVAVTVLVFSLTGSIAKAFDRGVGMLSEDFGFALSLPAAVWAQVIEETLEACLPLLNVIGAYQVAKARGDHPATRT